MRMLPVILKLGKFFFLFLVLGLFLHLLKLLLLFYLNYSEFVIEKFDHKKA